MGSRSRIQRCYDTPRGDTRQEYLSLIFLYAYHRPSSHTHDSTSEPILTGPPGTSSCARKVKEVYTGVHLTTRRDTAIRPSSLRRERITPRSVVHAQTHQYPRLLRVPYHPCAPFFDCLSPLGRGYSREESSIPSDFTPRCRSILSPNPVLFLRRKHPETET